MQIQHPTTLAQAAPRDGSDQAPAAPNALSTLLVLAVIVVAFFVLEIAAHRRRRARG